MNEKKKYEIEMTESQKDKVQAIISAFNDSIGFDLKLKEVKEFENAKEDKWLKYGDKYYYIDANAYDNIYILSTTCESNRFDLNRLAIGNVFKTRDEAEFEVERLKVLAEMRKFAEPNSCKWDGSCYHWSIIYDTVNRSIGFEYGITIKDSYIFFESKEAAEKCVKTIGEDRIKKYYFGEGIEE